ncbi:MAG: hypothetical protein HC853_05985 [Anaerolineae bacterium]|nr:hypothetical protein [Anaerolineae bacterium]
MTRSDQSDPNPSLAAKLVGFGMIAMGFSCLLFELLFSPGGPQSFGVAAFCFLFVYGLAKLRNK